MIDARLAIIVGGILLVLTPAISANNGFLAFSITIDNVSPYYEGFEGISLIENINDEFHCYALWNDSNILGTYVFEWNLTGLAKNDSAQKFVNGWSNITKTFNGADEGKSIAYRLHGRDWSGNWNSTYYKNLVIASISPEFFSVSQSNESPITGDPVNISSFWTDNFEVDHVQLQTNESGFWINNGSPVDIDNQSGWANFTIDTTGMNSSPYHWRLIGFDEVGNSNTTPIEYFLPQ